MARSRWADISASSSVSSCVLRKRERRRSRDWRRLFIDRHSSGAAFGLHGDDAIHDAGQSFPVGDVGGEMFAALFCEGIKFCFAIVGGSAPFGGDPAALLQPDEGGVDGALVEENFVAADLLDAAGDAVAVERAHGGEGLEDHEVQGALEEIEFGIGHGFGCSCVMAT